MSCIAHRTPSHPVPSQEVPGCHRTHPREEGTKGEAAGDPWPRKAKHDRSAAGHIDGTAHQSGTQQSWEEPTASLYGKRVGRWASGWALLNVHRSQRGWPARKVDKRHPESQKAESEALSSTGRPGKAPRETRVPWITRWPAGRRTLYRVQKGPVSWRLGLRTPWITTPGAEGKREL